MSQDSCTLIVQIFFEGAWLEVLGCGMIHKDIMANCGLGEHHGYAFGLGLERLAMVLFGTCSRVVLRLSPDVARADGGRHPENVHALEGLACRKRVAPASLPAVRRLRLRQAFSRMLWSQNSFKTLTLNSDAMSYSANAWPHMVP